MRGLLVAIVTLSGCSAVFDLREPVRQRDAAVIDDDDAAADASDAASDATPDAPSCPLTYAQVGSRSYRVVSDINASWLDAVADCADDGATTHLAVASSEDELTAIVAAYGNANELWLGLSDRVTDGTFLWVTAEDTLGFPPATGGPWGGSPGSAPCVLVKSSGELNTRDCSLTRHYLCECDAYANDPSRY